MPAFLTQRAIANSKSLGRQRFDLS